MQVLATRTNLLILFAILAVLAVAAFGAYEWYQHFVVATHHLPLACGNGEAGPDCPH